MSKVDDELTRRLRRAERPVDGDRLFEGLERRRSHRERVRRVRSALLAFAVLAATIGGFSILTRLFDPDRRMTGAVTPFGAEGAIVTCGDDTGGQICRIDADALSRGATSQDLVRLTDFTGTLVSEPAVSADGTTVVFERRPPIAGTSSLWTVRTDGARLSRLAPAEGGLADPSWSPEGTIVAVADEGGPDGTGPAELVILDPGAVADPVIETIELPGLTFPSAPSFSPDGTEILFVAGEDPNSAGADVYTIDTHGSNLTNLTRTPRSEWAAAWSPDGQRIAFGFGSPSGEELFDCPLDCSNPRRLEDPSGVAIYGALPAWSPDGKWLAFEVVEEDQDPAIHVTRLDGSEVRTLASPASGFAWIPAPEVNPPEPSPEPELAGHDIGLGFRLCHLQPLGRIDFLGDGTEGKAWTGTKVLEGGTCPNDIDNRYGVAADFTGDGVADSWSGETIESCVGCEPFKAVDLNGDGRDEPIVIQSYFSIMQYGIYTVLSVPGEADPQVVPFRIGEPGHPQHALEAGDPFTFWVGGDAGSADYFYCDSLPDFWLTGKESPIDPAPDDVTTIHETHVSLRTDGVAEILYANTFTVPAGTEVDLQYATSTPDCGLGVDIWR